MVDRHSIRQPTIEEVWESDLRGESSPAAEALKGLKIAQQQSATASGDESNGDDQASASNLLGRQL